MRQLFQAGQLFQGVVSNCSQGVLSTTSGKITTTAFTRSVSGSINTTHHHYTTFDIGNMGFKLKGDYPLRDGDAVVFYAAPSGGYYEVQTIANFTRNYFIRDKLGSLRGIYFGFISGILSACAAIILAFCAIIDIAKIGEVAAYLSFITSGWCITSFAGAIVAKPRYKQNKIIENYNPHLTQADNIALTQAQLANESKKRFLSLPSLLFWALAGALTTAMLAVVSVTINAQWAKSISLWLQDSNKNALIAWVVATLVLWVLILSTKENKSALFRFLCVCFWGFWAVLGYSWEWGLPLIIVV